MAAPPPGQRYKLESVLDKGGMGVVYRARDNTTQREVAIKTLNDVGDKAAYEQFRREFEILSNLRHPNIVDIYDVGEFEGHPGFVMPLLPGQNLATLIRAKELTVDRVVDIVSQVCRGLQAAHDSGLVHRDLKPANIFVLPGDAVKIIDFGIASMVDRRHSMQLRGTILYMAPEQTRLLEATPESDLYSLGVVCYEALTGTHPFLGSSDEAIVKAVRHTIPPPVSRINSDVSELLSQVIHKAMAKQPSLRFSSADDFKKCLQKASRGESIEYFNETRIQERLSRIRGAISGNNHDLASEILSNLEGEIYHPDISTLRNQIAQSVRSKQTREYLANARQRLDVDEYELALEWIQKILELEPTHPEGLQLKNQIEERRSAKQIEDWLRLGQTHLDNNSFSRAREAADNVLGLRPTEGRAIQLRSDIDRREQEYGRARKEKEELYRQAIQARQDGELSSALSKLEQIVKLESLAPDTSSSERQKLYEEIRSEYDSLTQSIEDIRRLRTEKNYDRALQLCDEILAVHPVHAVVQDLKLTTEADRRQELHSYIAEVTAQVQKEADLDRKVAILQEAIERHSSQPDFQQLLQGVEQRRNLVGSIVAKAREYEETEKFTEGLAQWATLESIYPQYPGLEFEIHRLKKREGLQRRAEKKMRRVEEIEAARRLGDWDRAEPLIADALDEFADDKELLELRSMLFAEKQKADEAEELFQKASVLLKSPQTCDEGLSLMEQAHEFNPRNLLIRSALLDALLSRARDTIDTDWKAAEELVSRAVSLDKENKDATGLRTLIADRRRSEDIDGRIAEIRRLEGSGDLKGALDKARAGITEHPLDKRLSRLETGLLATLNESQTSYSRQKDLDQIRDLATSAEKDPDPALADSIWQRTQALAGRYGDDTEVADLVTAIHTRLNEDGAANEFSPESATVFSSPQPVAEPPKAKEKVKEIKAKAPVKDGAAPGGLQLLMKNLATDRKTQMAAAGLLAAVMLMAVVVVVIAFWPASESSAPVVAGSISTDITTDPSGAEVFIDGESAGLSPLSSSLPPGEHVFTARLAGFYDQQSATTLEALPPADGETVGAAANVPVHLALQPMPLNLEFEIGLDSGTVKLDGQEVINLATSSEFVVRNVPPGEHLVEFQGAGRATASFGFIYELGRAPTLVPLNETSPSLLRAGQLRAVVFTGLGGKGQLHSSSQQTTAAFGSLAGMPLPLTNVSLDATAGSAMLHDGSWEREIALGTAPEPALQVFLFSDRDEGDVYITANDSDDIIVMLDGRRLQRFNQRGGQIRLLGLRTGVRTVELRKNGFKADPPSQKVTVVKGEAVTAQPVRFEALRTVATLRIVNGAPGTTVTVDGEGVGVIGGNGTLVASVQAGNRTVELSRPGYVSASITQQLTSGQTAEISGDDHVLKPATGTIAFSGIPSGAQLDYTGTILEAGGSSSRRLATIPAELQLPTGTYNLTITVPGSGTWSATIQLAEGQRLPITPKLGQTAVVENSPWVAVLGDGWANTSDGWQEATTSGLLWTARMPSTGARYSFVVTIPSALLGKGDPVEWVVSIMGSTERFIRFGINEKEFLVRGEAVGNHDLRGKSEQQIVVEVSGTNVRTSIGSSFSYVMEAPIDLRSAQFGFESKAGKPIRVKNFQSSPLSGR